MASPAAWQELPLPQHKGVPGWEFTELKKFDLAAFPRAEREERKVEIPEPVLPAPEGSILLTQVDAAWPHVPTATVLCPLVMPL